MPLIPTTCKMPDINVELRRLQPDLLLLSAFVGPGNLSQNAANIRRHVVRLTDKAVLEYSLSRQAILNQIEEMQRPYEELVKGRILHMLAFTDHMENCIGSVRRVLGLLQCLRADLSAPAQDRIARRLIEANEQPLVAIRNAFEHFGDAVSKNEFSDGQLVVLGLSDDESGVTLGPHVLTFSSLASILRALHSEASRLVSAPYAE